MIEVVFVKKRENLSGPNLDPSTEKFKGMRIKKPGVYTSASLFLTLAFLTLALALAACGDFTATPGALVPAVSAAATPATPAVIPAFTATAGSISSPGAAATATPNAAPPTAPATSTPRPTEPALPTATATVTATSAAAPSGPTSTPAPAGTPEPGAALQTLDLSFTGDTQGWALVSSCAGSSCKALLKTTNDGGRNWQTLAAPPVEPGFFPQESRDPKQVARVYFANSQDGWLFGPGFYSTHDGGKNWQAGDFPGDIIEMASAGKTTLAVTRTCPSPSAANGCGYGLISSGDYGRSWQKAANFPAIAVPQAQLLPLSEKDFWLLSAGAPLAAGDPSTPAPSLLATHDGGKNWQVQANPCAKRGGAEARLAAANPQNLFIVCAGQPGAGQQPKYLFSSGDSGQSWQERGTMAGTFSGYLGSFTASAPGKLWLALTRYTLLSSADGGLNWEAALPIEKANPSNGRIGPVIFADALHGWFAADQGRIFYTLDGGATWQPANLK